MSALSVLTFIELNFDMFIVKAVILSSRLKSGGEFNLEVGFGRLVLEPKGQPDIPALGEPANEAQMMLEIISESIKSLIRIGMIVRSSTSCDRFKKALHTLGPIFCDGPDINHVKEKYPKIQDDRLLARLGNANAKRRRVIAYYRDHTSRLGGHFDDNNPDQLSSKATTFAADNFAQVQAKFDRGDSESASSTTVSTEFSASLNPDLPRLVELSNREESFKCPICQTIQTFKREKSWRLVHFLDSSDISQVSLHFSTHAFRDLYAYVCTAGEAGCEDQIFGDRESWFAHELKHHRAKYKCALCADGSFSPKDLRHHFQEIHRIPDEQQLRALQDMSQLNSSAFNARDCPFCDDWADALCSRKDPKGKGNESSQNHTGILVSSGRFRRHVATHLEYLSIFALPRATEEKGADESESPIESLSDTTSQSEADLDLIQQQKHSQSLDPAPKPEEAVKFATTTTKKPEEDQVHNVLPKYSTEQATTKPIVKTGMVRGPSTTAMGRGAKSIVETWACVSPRQYIKIVLR